ncbi:secretin and TonB N-terminal domain-containing protein [uncultured Piscinibacter sp.]|uniref:secretin and TonB N-terminal domain-containing protein n=1 Tax=uncultured Piscinibacter sp. TaxID=1131835 RepID=UPI002602F7A9|nr:secretin and TonB N-terminal domain-containing protein [uncultured Piscinibacter sp.]
MHLRSHTTLALALALSLLAGCATDTRRQQALALLDQGRYEEGLATLAEASRERPGNVALRAEWLGRQEQVIGRLLAIAQGHLAAGQIDEAQAQFERVVKLQPDHPRARAGLEAVAAQRRHVDLARQAQGLLAAGDRDGALALARAVLRENPAQREARTLIRQLEEQRQRETLAGPALKARQQKPVTLEFRDASLRSAISALSRSTGINFVFDKDVKSDAKTTIYANQVSVEDAIDLLLMTNQLEKKVVSENTILVYPATAQKLREYQELMIRNFYLENADAKQTLNLVKTMLKTKDVFIDEKLNLLVMRDTPEAIRLAEKLIAAHDLAEPEVVLEVEVLEVTHSRLSELGVKWTDQFGFGVVDITGTPFVLRDLRGINSSRIAVNSPTATLNLKATDGDSNILASPRIRVKNREKARIQIGDRVPVISGQTTVATGNVLSAETITYLDVGLKLEVEPNVHLDDDVDIKVALEVSTLGEKTTTANGSVAYRVGTRNANTVLRLQDGETQVLMGLIRDDERRSANRVPGIGEMPVLSHLFGSHQTDKQKTEIVLAITPRLVRNVRHVEAQLTEFWSGTEGALRSAPLFARTLSGVGAAAPALPGASAPSGAAARSPAAAAPAEGVSLAWSGPAQGRVGEEITLVLNARTAQPLAGAAVQVTYDPASLAFVRFAEGSFMKGGGAPTAVNHRVDTQAGVLRARFARVGGGASGEGDLMAVTFKVLDSQASTQVQAVAVSPVGPGNRMLGTQPSPPHQLAVAR